MGLEQSGPLLSVLWWEGTQQPKRLVKASAAPSGYTSAQSSSGSTCKLIFSEVCAYLASKWDMWQTCAQRRWADSPDVQLFPAQVGKRNGSSRASHSNYQLWQDHSPLSAGNEKHKTKPHPETQQNINSFVYTVSLLSGISLALEQRNSCEGRNSAG